jgi:hypothetical protein
MWFCWVCKIWIDILHVLLRPDHCLLGGLQSSGVLLLFLLLKLDGFLSAWAENLDSYNSCSWDQMGPCLLGQVLIIHVLETWFLSAWVENLDRSSLAYLKANSTMSTSCK